MTQKLYLTEIILIKVVRVLLGLRLVNIYLRVALHVRVRVHLVIKMWMEEVYPTFRERRAMNSAKNRLFMFLFIW